MPTRDSARGSAATSPPRSAGTIAAPHYVGPTDAITAVAIAITVEHKSLDVLVSVAPILTRLEERAFAPGASPEPVTISIAFISTVGAERQTQAYSALAGNRFVHADAEADGQPRSVHLDITLTQPKPKGGEYTFNIPIDLNFDPLYDVAVYPLEFTLLNSSAIVGPTTVVLYYIYPDGNSATAKFDTDADKMYSVAAFKWSRDEASASDGLLTPALAYYVTADYRRRRLFTRMDPGRPSASNPSKDARRQRRS